MNTTKLLGLVGGVVVLVAGAYFVLSPYAQQIEEDEYSAYSETAGSRVTEGAFAPNFSAATKTTAQNEVEVTEVKKATETPKPTPTPVPTPTPTPTPTPVTPSGYTMAEVAVHNSETSCWSVISGSVYDLTSYVPKHPGGERNILKICGKDGTAAFSGQHGGDSKPEATLAKHRIGALLP